MKKTVRRNVIDPDRDRAQTREACMEMDNIRKDHQRDSDAAERSHNKQMAEWRERNRS